MLRKLANKADSRAEKERWFASLDAARDLVSSLKTGADRLFPSACQFVWGRIQIASPDLDSGTTSDVERFNVFVLVLETRVCIPQSQTGNRR